MYNHPDINGYNPQALVHEVAWDWYCLEAHRCRNLYDVAQRLAGEGSQARADIWLAKYRAALADYEAARKAIAYRFETQADYRDEPGYDYATIHGPQWA